MGELVVVDDEYLIFHVFLDELAKRMKIRAGLFAIYVVERLLTHDLLHVVFLCDVLLGANVEDSLSRTADKYLV